MKSESSIPCFDCGGPKSAGSGETCRACYTIRSHRRRDEKERAIKFGRCISCRKPKSDGDFIRCDKCMGQLLKSSRRAYEHEKSEWTEQRRQEEWLREGKEYLKRVRRLIQNPEP